MHPFTLCALDACRFTLPEDLVVPFLSGKYSVNEYADDMKRKGKKDGDIDAACKLFSQVRFR